MDNSSATTTFKIITPGKLKTVAVIPQAIDNVWLPLHLLKQVIQRGQSIEDVSAQLQPEVKKEWRRALLYSEQVVANRAFFYNSKTIITDFVTPYHPNTIAFGKLLDEQVILPFLYTEEPNEKPKNFDIDEKGWKAWNDLGGPERATFVRLSEDKEVNKSSSENMGVVFRQYLELLKDPISGPQIFSGFCADAEAAESCYSFFLRNHNSLMEDISQKNEEAKRNGDEISLVSRGTLYNKFLWKDDNGVSPLIRKFDPEKKFGYELKQIFDLKYCVNSPDFLDRYALTAYGMPNRSMLRDYLSIGIRRTEKEADLKELYQSLKRLTYDSFQQGLYLKTVGALELPDIAAIRSFSDPLGLHDHNYLDSARKNWTKLVTAQQELLKEPLQFPELGIAFHKSFVELNESVLGLIKPRLKDTQFDAFHPIIKFIFEIPGLLSVIFLFKTSDMHGIPFQIVEHQAGHGVGKFGGKLIGRVVASYMTERKSKSDLEFSMTFMEKTLSDARKTWPEFVRSLQKDSSFYLTRIPDDKAAVINYEEEFTGELD